MKKACIFILLIFSLINVKPQFYEDFSSKSFKTNNWQGDTSKYKFSTSTSIPSAMRPGLQTNDNAANTTHISAPFSQNFDEDKEWNFWIKLSFTPSSSNFARVYLASDVADLKSDLKGYYVGIGENDKKLSLVKQDGYSTQSIIQGSVANFTKSTNVVRVKVIRLKNGTWELYSDTTGGRNYSLEGKASDNSFTSMKYLGLYSKYTSSNATKIYFDEFYAGNVIFDTEKPRVEQLIVVSDKQLDIIFNEPVNPSLMFGTATFEVDNGVGSPNLITQNKENPTRFHLFFNNPFPINTNLTITISGVSDLAGNVMETTVLQFSYYLAKPFDIVINEIMANPTPPIQLPEYEYVELFNRTNLAIDLSNWTISFGNSIKTFGNARIEANGYLIITSDAAKPLFEKYGNVYSFSSISITNTGQLIILKDKNGTIIHSVNFSDSWYGDSYKANGGWSLEMIDTDNPCGEKNNWKASTSKLGGTPGLQNSVYARNPDLKIPELLRAATLNDSTVRIWFSEKIDLSTATKKQNFEFSDNLTLTETPLLVEPYYNSIILKVSPKLQNNKIYSLTVKDSIFDCVGNKILQNSKVYFGLPDTIGYNDIVVNEILSNPPASLDEFVEIYNRTTRIFDLKDLKIANIDSKTGQISSIKDIATENFQMFPNTYYVITKNADGVRNYYYCENPNNFIEVSSMPSYPNSSGSVVLVRNDGLLIDRVDYDEDMHFPLLTTTKGVSLERLNPDRPSNDKSNWASAAETVGFATPTYKNSKYTEQTINQNEEIALSPEIFSPDNDGYNDLLNINYNFAENGYVVNVNIFDSKGRLIRNLVKNELVSRTGTFVWNGITNDNQKANIGIYIVVIEVFNLKGEVKTFKKTTVLGGKLN